MSVRIISGFLQGRRIASPVSNNTRPTTDMLRSAVFSALGSRYNLQGAHVLDVCCGTGSFGIECLSRGAAKATFVDSSAQVCSQLTKTLQMFNIEDKAEVFADDALHFLNGDKNSYDLLFADPPYHLRMCNAIASAVDSRRLLSDGGLLIVEHGDMEVLISPPTLRKLWHKQQGESIVEIYARADAEP
ncbi:MAG: 16S rRNA (guanine(966)-N(2))-methyltransferase RsmD [Ignavibacteria bacterium]|nr:16S rRNA (guanine(966)-N(2))-methyltransferase RsmD [Ignavibacteria bacterium]